MMLMMMMLMVMVPQWYCDDDSSGGDSGGGGGGDSDCGGGSCFDNDVLITVMVMKQGIKMLWKFKQLLNPAQVFDLISGGPNIG